MAPDASAAYDANRPADISPEEWEVRVNLAAAYRLVDLFGWSDLLGTHLSARVPGPDEHFLINPFGVLFEEMTASALIKVDEHGTCLTNSDYSINPAAFVIHSAVHLAVPELSCVMHTHTRDGVGVACQAEGILPISQQALSVYAHTAYHDYEGIALDLSERERLVADLGDKWAMVLYNHGILTLGETVSHAFSRLYYFEQACRVQLDVLATGRPIKMPSPEVCEHTAKQWEPNGRDWEPGAAIPRNGQPICACWIAKTHPSGTRTLYGFGCARRLTHSVKAVRSVNGSWASWVMISKPLATTAPSSIRLSTISNFSIVRESRLVLRSVNGVDMFE